MGTKVENMSFLKSVIFLGSQISKLNKIGTARNPISFSLGNVSQFSSSVNSVLGFNRMSITSSLSPSVPMLTTRSPVVDQTRSVTKWSLNKGKRKIRGARHVFCNSTQSTLLDKMVTKFWRKPHYYVDDIYRPYHQREEFVKTAMKPH